MDTYCCVLGVSVVILMSVIVILYSAMMPFCWSDGGGFHESVSVLESMGTAVRL